MNSKSPAPGMQLLCALVSLITVSTCFTPAIKADTAINLGQVKQIFGAEDLDLEGNILYAIRFTPSGAAKVVRGVTFVPDAQKPAGVALVLPQGTSNWQTQPDFGSTRDEDALEEILHDIRWANSSANERLSATLPVLSGEEYKLQILMSGNTLENRRWDIRINGTEAVDEITSLGASPGQSYSPIRATLYTYQFVANFSSLIVEMGNLFGANDGGDRNPLWQALTLERMSIPATPDDITLDSTIFYRGETAKVGQFKVLDQKGANTTHTVSFAPGVGDTDNAKFSISGADLFPFPFNFSNQPGGSTYSIRVRATDTSDPSRFLEKTFIITLAVPQAPTNITLDTTTVSSATQPGTLVAHIHADDPDLRDQQTFALVAGDGDRDNPLLSVSGSDLRLLSPISKDATQLKLRIRATDSFGLFSEFSLVLSVITPQLRINEVIGSEVAGVLDEKKLPQEWIELANPSAQSLDLTGYYLTDDSKNLTKWKFPAATISANGYVVILADGIGTAPVGSTNLHANFSVSSSGEWLGLVAPDGLTIISELNLPEIFPGVAYGIGADGRPGYLTKPTPWNPNGAISDFGLNEVSFSQPHGFFSHSFPLELTATVPGSIIRYTLDATKPTASSGVVYSGPITITPSALASDRGVRIVRAIAVNPNAAYAPVKAQTYIFVQGSTSPAADGVVNQQKLVAAIRTNATYGPLLPEAFLALPAVSLILPQGPSTTEKAATVEFFDPNGQEDGFEIDCGIVATGTTSLGSPKLSMAAKFRSKYGKSKLRYPMFARGSMFPEGAATEFKHLRLRSHSHDTFFWLGTRENPPVPYGSPPVKRSGDALLMRNLWMDEMQLMMGQPGKHGRQVHLYLNGAYHGIYHIHEHPDSDYMASYYSGPSEDFHSTAAATGGSTHAPGDTWTKPWTSLKNSLANFNSARRWVDMTNLCDYMILSFYAGNDWDWSAQHNWGAAGPKFPDRGGWKFFEQDSDVALQDSTADCTDQDVPDGIFTALMRLPDFRVLFRDRFYKHCFNDGVLTPTKAYALFESRMNEISTAIIAESARWQPSSSIAKLPWDRDEEWKNEWNYFKTNFFPLRTSRLLTQFKAHSTWWPMDPPVPNHENGPVPAGFELAFTNKTGTVYFTTDGTDPRLQGGGISPAATKVTTGFKLLVDRPMVVKSRVYTGTDWSALVETFLAPDNVPAASAANFILSEIHYHPMDDASNEFLEFLNTSTAPIDLSDVQITNAVSFLFPKGTWLAGGERIAVAKDLTLFDPLYRTPTSAYFHENIRALGPWEGSLGNTGENIVIQTAAGVPIFHCAYDARGAWPGRADGKGSSLELIDPTAAPLTEPEKSLWLSEATNWRPSSEFHGSPGWAGSGPDSRIAINEVFPASVPPETDAIELLNISSAEQILDRWFLSDSALNYRKYRFPTDTRLSSGAFLVLRESDFNNSQNPASLEPFALNSDGDDLYLVEADSSGALLRFVDRIEFGSTPAGVALGRWPNGTGPLIRLPMPSLGTTNPPPMSYSTWAMTAFPEGTPAEKTAAGADPDGDGLSNFVEYAFALPPLEPGSRALKFAGNTEANFTFTYHIRTSASDLHYRVDVSNDLAAWDTSGSQVQFISQTSALDGSTEVIARLVSTGATSINARFVRVVALP